MTTDKNSMSIEEIPDDNDNIDPSNNSTHSTSYSAIGFSSFQRSALLPKEASVLSALKSRLALEAYLAIALTAIGAVIGTFIFPAVGTAVGAGLGLALASVIIGAESLVLPSRPSHGEKASYLRPLIGAILFVGGAVALMGLLSWVALPAVGIAVSLDTSISLAFMSLPFLMLCGIWNQFRKQPTHQETDLTIGIEVQNCSISNKESSIAESKKTNLKEAPKTPNTQSNQGPGTNTELYQGRDELRIGLGSLTSVPTTNSTKSGVPPCSPKVQ